MNKKLFVGLFFGFIFFIFLFVPFKEVAIHFNILKHNKTDNWVVVEKSDNPIYDKLMTAKYFVENRYNNYFPLYDNINSLYFNTIINIDSLYMNDIYLKDNNDGDHIFFDKTNNFFYLTNKYSSKELDERMNREVEFYNDIKEKYPDINLALYIPLRYEMTEAKNVNDVHKKIEEFESKLNKEIKYMLFDSKTTSDYMKYYYKTDHHYNSYGAEKAYLEILNMFNLTNSIDIKHNSIRTPYYGSMAKSTLLKRVEDTLTVMTVPNTLKIEAPDKDFKPMSIENKSNPFFDYYVKYYNGAYDELIYENNTTTNRNLLIIGDSMVWQYDYMLAYNFDKTYVVNTKYGKWLKQDLNLKEYIAENKITHILFVREAKNLIFDADNYKVDKKVVR